MDHVMSVELWDRSGFEAFVMQPLEHRVTEPSWKSL